MKKRFKLLLLFLGLISIYPNINVKAQTYQETFNQNYKYIPGTFLVKEKEGNKKYQQLTVIVRNSDNQFVYCIEPGVPLSGDEIYTGQDYDQQYVANMTQSQWRRIQLLAYYGYQYSDSMVNHSDLKWYSVTQFMIWQTVPHGQDIYFTDSLNGNRITKYASEIEEMETLLNQHYTTPDFGNTNYEMIIGNTLKLSDKNNVLSKYSISDNSFFNISKNGNDLYLTANAVGNTSINLIKKDVKYSHPAIVYVKPGTQDIVQVGSYDPIDTKLNINVVGGRIAINKIDYETGLSSPQGEATLKGAIYGVYKEDGTYVTRIVTDENGYAKSDYLPNIGKFYLQEITASNGYQLDQTKYYFEISKDNLEPLIPVQEKVITRNYEITKVFASDKTQIMVPEKNIEFGIYDKNNILVKRLTTDDEGKIYFTLPFGSYVLKQLTTTGGHEMIKDFHFTIKDLGPTINHVFSNAGITSRIKVIKVDQNGSSITKAGIKFKIKNLENGKYVCQTISYPTIQNICEYQTDKNGVLITPYPLGTGKYQLEEVDQIINGYVWNSTPLPFTIDEKSNIISTDEFDAILELHFKNDEVKGKIEINKIGEQLVIENGSYIYKEIPLPNVIFGLYDETGKLILTVTTDENGYALIENLKLGKYVLKEIKTSGNNILDNKEYVIELEYKDQYTPIVSEKFVLKNYLGKGILEFTKTDLSSGKELPNVKIQIFTVNDELVFEGITDENGKIIINNLFFGKFYIIETKTIDGYLLSDEKVYFEILEDGQIVKATMTNEKIEMPKTFNTDLVSIIIICGTSLIGAGLLLYAKKRKDK